MLEEKCSELLQKQVKLNATINVLQERVETYRTINEKLQFENHAYEQQIEKMKFEMGAVNTHTSTCKLKSLSLDEGEKSEEVAHMNTPNKVPDKVDIDRTPESSEIANSNDNWTPSLLMSKRRSSFTHGKMTSTPEKCGEDEKIDNLHYFNNETPKSTRKRKYNSGNDLTSQALPKRLLTVDNLSFDEETQDSGIGSNKTSVVNNEKIDLTDQEMQSITKGLFNINSKKNSSAKHKVRQSPIHENDESRSSRASDDTQTKENKEMKDYMSNFGHKESFTNNNGITTTYIWLNKTFKMLYDDWKIMLKLKDESKFTKNILKAMHINENNSHDENLSRRCVSVDKVSYTPGGVNRRIPLDRFEHVTIEKCLAHYCQKVLKKNKEESKKIIAKKNNFITEDINVSVKNIKSKNSF